MHSPTGTQTHSTSDGLLTQSIRIFLELGAPQSVTSTPKSVSSSYTMQCEFHSLSGMSLMKGMNKSLTELWGTPDVMLQDIFHQPLPLSFFLKATWLHIHRTH